MLHYLQYPTNAYPKEYWPIFYVTVTEDREIIRFKSSLVKKVILHSLFFKRYLEFKNINTKEIKTDTWTIASPLFFRSIAPEVILQSSLKTDSIIESSFVHKSIHKTTLGIKDIPTIDPDMEVVKFYISLTERVILQSSLKMFSIHTSNIINKSIHKTTLGVEEV